MKFLLPPRNSHAPHVIGKIAADQRYDYFIPALWLLITIAEITDQKRGMPQEHSSLDTNIMLVLGKLHAPTVGTALYMAKNSVLVAKSSCLMAKNGHFVCQNDFSEEHSRLSHWPRKAMEVTAKGRRNRQKLPVLVTKTAYWPTKTALFMVAKTATIRQTSNVAIGRVTAIES